ncbi:MAG: metal ABC transporter ATP-binding protein [Nitrospiraceae bacterium]|nr:metal ABC transporter ATP-binding protein [Nitrospiraceae bacterium]
MSIAVEIDSLTVKIKNKDVLKNVSFTLEEGLFLGIVGPNAGGKTTLVRTILGLARPSSGSVRVFGKSPEGHLVRGGAFGYLPQHQNIDPGFPASVIDIVLMGRYNAVGFFRWPGKKDTDKALRSLAVMGVEDLKDAQYTHLSGGQQQRVSIARALAGDPRVLILDEPSTGIDVVGQEDFYHLLKGLQKKMNLTILMVSHDIGTVTTYVDEIACLNINLYYHGNPLGALNEKVLTSLYGKNVDLLLHTDVCEKCERLR